MTIAAVPPAGIDARSLELEPVEPAAEGFDIALADAQAATREPRRVDSRPARTPTKRNAPGAGCADAPVADDGARPDTDAADVQDTTVAATPLALPGIVVPAPAPAPVDAQPAATAEPADVDAALPVAAFAPTAQTPEAAAVAQVPMPESDADADADALPAAEVFPAVDAAPAPDEAASVATLPPADAVTNPAPAPAPHASDAPAELAAPAPDAIAPDARAAVPLEVPVMVAPSTVAPNDDDNALTAPPDSAPAPISAARIDAPTPTDAAADAAPARSAPPPPPAEQLVNVLRPLRHGRDGSYTLRLEMKPPELGRVELRIEMQGGVLHASLHADDEHAAQVLRDALGDLRARLQSEGVRAGELTVGDGRANHRRDPRENLPEHANRSDQPAHTPAATRASGAVRADGLDVRV